MKPLLAAVLTACAVGLPGLVLAQGVEGAVKGGVIFADIPKFAEMLEEDEGEAEMRIGIVAGAHVAFTLGGVVALQTEVLFAQKGIKATAPLGLEDLELELDYIGVPVLLRLGATGRNGLQFLVGPAFNFNVAARAKFSGVFDEEEDVKDEVENIDIGLVLGAGYYGSIVIVEGRYEEGLTDIAEFTDFGEDENYRNRGFTVLVGLRFGR
jgi:hypothetical protein